MSLPNSIVSVARRLVKRVDRQLGARADKIRRLPPFQRVLRFAEGIPQNASEQEAIFTPRYGFRNLRDPKDGSYSGPGSTVTRTEAIREALPKLLRELNIETMIDAPCGDMKWMHTVELPVMRYIGVDVIRGLIETNTKLYADEQHSFVHLDLVHDVLPPADLVFNRDMLIHLSYADSGNFIAQLKRSGARYLLTTHFPEQTANQDIATGGFRVLNLERAPFHFPAPLRVISEHYTANPLHSDKCMALWEIASLPLPRSQSN
jgi:hypothetical protein